MKEDFLHYVWKYQLMDISALITTKNETLSIVYLGIHNQDQGPDFLNAKIRISDQLWVGNVEIHIKSSDWYWHQHENDENYDAVILHVVWEDDVQIFMKNNQVLPTLVLKNFVNKGLVRDYEGLTQIEERWIPCEHEISNVNSFTFDNWMERLYFERLERKSIFIQELLRETKNDWDAVLFALLAKNFGLNKNGEAFYQLARSIPFSIVRKVAQEHKSLSALLFGQAGFLDENYEEHYHSELKREYEYLQKKFSLHPMKKKQFQFFRMRPSNFPTIRLAQLVAIYANSRNLFSNVIECSSVDQLYSIFEIKLDDFWKTHYTFSKTSKKSPKTLTRSFIDLLTINTIIPLKFAYQKAMNQLDEQMLVSLLELIKPEENSIVTKFEEIDVEVKSAFTSQSLLELKNNYCVKKRCLECAIGNELLKR